MSYVALGSVLGLERIPLEVDLDTEYVQIGIRSFGKGIFHRVPTKGENLSKLRYFELKPNRLVVSNIMAWEGAIAISGDAEKGCIGSSRFLTYAPIGEIDLPYINYFFQSEMGRSLIQGTSTGTVLRNQTLSIKDFESIKVPLPDLEEQRRISTHLSSSFAKLDQVLVLRADLYQLAAAIKESLIVDSLRGPTSEYLVDDVIKLKRRPVEVVESKMYREIGIRSFGKGVFHKPSTTGIELNGKRVFWIEPDDLIFSNIFAWEGAVGVASKEEEGMIGSHRFMTYRVESEDADLRYLFSYFTSSVGLEMIRRSSPGSAGRNKTLGIKSFAQQKMALPRLSVQKKTAQLIDGMQEVIVRSLEVDKRVTALKASLLNKAFGDFL
ncbi:restriction endonuclease subunit S [Streptosporangium sp. NPDC002721]|uniref:restriction endonuclease subunit S n=1 Tax=Streptosporangium sp. NPDC002721 TaxID=3366188 RepID=UPI003690C77F